MGCKQMADRTAGHPIEREWRVRSAARAFCWIGIVVSIPLSFQAVVWGFDTNREFGGLVLGGLLAMCALFLWRFGIHPRLRAFPDGLEIRNGLSARFVLWSQIDRCTPGYGGLWLILKDGQRQRIWAIQKSNLMTWLNRRTRADEVADFIEMRAQLRFR